MAARVPFHRERFGFVDPVDVVHIEKPGEIRLGLVFHDGCVGHVADAAVFLLSLLLDAMAQLALFLERNDGGNAFVHAEGGGVEHQVIARDVGEVQPKQRGIELLLLAVRQRQNLRGLFLGDSVLLFDAREAHGLGRVHTDMQRVPISREDRLGAEADHHGGVGFHMGFETAGGQLDKRLAGVGRGQVKLRAFGEHVNLVRGSFAQESGHHRFARYKLEAQLLRQCRGHLAAETAALAGYRDD